MDSLDSRMSCIALVKSAVFSATSEDSSRCLMRAARTFSQTMYRMAERSTRKIRPQNQSVWKKRGWTFTCRVVSSVDQVSSALVQRTRKV